MKKRHFSNITLPLLLLLLTFTIQPGTGSCPWSSDQVFSISNSECDIQPANLENVWYYRTYNGKRQKRLWSATEKKWLTDWIDC